ncbi:MAG: glycosyltransferase [Flavobacterium sp.]|nr:glycosyltransferase [Flavobacterium sp.]
MKIIRLSTFLDYGGIESKMANLSSFQDGNEWVFVAIGKGGIAESRIRGNKKTVFCFNLPHRIPSPITIFKLYRFFKEAKPQVVHSSGAEANFHGVIAAKMAKIPVVIAEEIGIAKQSKVAKLIFRLIYRLADFVLGESKAVTDNLRSNYAINTSKLKVVDNFTLFPKIELTTKASENSVFQLLTVSRLEPVKNIEGIIRVMQRLKSENYNIKYTIVGDGSSRYELLHLVKASALEKEIDWVGFQQKTLPFYLQSDLFILNSFSEGFSNALLEAMYCKKIVITTKVGAADEIIMNDKNGFTIDCNDDNQLYEMIKLVLHLSLEKQQQIQNAAHQSVVANYAIESHVAKLMSVYNLKS